MDTDGYEAEMEAGRKKAKAGGHFGDLKATTTTAAAAATTTGAAPSSLSTATHEQHQQAIEMLAEQMDALKNKMSVDATDDSPKYTWTSTGSGEVHSASVKAIIDTSKRWADRQTTA